MLQLRASCASTGPSYGQGRRETVRRLDGRCHGDRLRSWVRMEGGPRSAKLEKQAPVRCPCVAFFPKTLDDRLNTALFRSQHEAGTSMPSARPSPPTV